MTYPTLMVHLAVGPTQEPLLNVAVELAQRHRSHVIGVAACQPMPLMMDGGYVDGTLYETFRKEMEREMGAAETRFRAAMQGHSGTVEWRSAMTYGLLIDFLAEQSRSAELVLTSAASGDVLDSSRAVDTGALLMHLGRPLLVVPQAGKTATPVPNLERVLVAWKDTREARRAVADAVPLLASASHVTVAEVASEENRIEASPRVKDVAAWLLRHGVRAEAATRVGSGNDGQDLQALAQELNAGVVVAGGYGHGRLREWAFGGVTRSLVQQHERCVLMSH